VPTASPPTLKTAKHPDPEVIAKPHEYKRKILAEADKCKEPGEFGALLRREGLYSSHLANWRAARPRAEEARPQAQAKPKPDDKDRKIAELERKLTKARVRAEKAEFLVDMQKNGAVPRRPGDDN
jgi:hypothetical protein